MIYLDNAATTMVKPPSVEREMVEALKGGYGNPGRGAGGPPLKSLGKIFSLRQRISQKFGGESPLKIVLSPGVTWSLNEILKSLIKEGDGVLTSVWEHNSVLRPLYQLEEQGADLTFLPSENGRALLTEKVLKKNTRFLVLTAASNVTGAANDLKEAERFAREHDLILIVDGAQALGTIPQPLGEIGEIIYCFTGHKGLHGPMGSGGAIIKGEYDFTPVFSGGSGYNSLSKEQPSDLPGIFEPGTLPVVPLMGLYGALEWDPDMENLARIRRRMVKDLARIPGILLYDFGEVSASVISFNLPGISAAEGADYLWREGEIVLRSGTHCAPLAIEALKTTGTMRLAPDETLTEEDWATALSHIEALSKKGIL